MGAAPIASVSPAEFLARAIAFGLLVVAGIAAAGLLLAVAGLIVSLVALLADEQPSSWRSSRSTALILGLLSVAALVIALVAP